jgi:hypothetical protein
MFQGAELAIYLVKYSVQGKMSRVSLDRKGLLGKDAVWIPNDARPSIATEIEEDSKQKQMRGGSCDARP